MRGMSEAMRAALADKAELLPFELVHAAARLPRSTAAQAPAAVNAAPTAAPSPPVLEASAAPFAPRRPDRPASRNHRSPTSRWPRLIATGRPARTSQGGRFRTPPPSSGLCFYHYHFGGDAHRCTPPCNWRAENY